MRLPTIADIEKAATRIAGNAVRTPLLTSPELDARTGARVFVKPECLQRTGSFKFRGAFNAVSALGEAARKGVVASSSGNHAQGVAVAARLAGVPATIVMPSDAPAIKIERTRRSGAEVVLYDRETQDRDAIAEAIVARTGAAYVHPYENFDVVSGQGTCGLEIAGDLAALGIAPDRVFVCCGGGGLTAGTAIAIQSRFPAARVHPVEPAGFDDYGQSLRKGERVRNPRLAGSACDALLTPSPGELSFAVNRERLSDGLSVSDAEAFVAMRFAFAEFKIVLEPGGAVALAALLASGRRHAGETVVVVASGGNADPAQYARVLAGEL